MVADLVRFPFSRDFLLATHTLSTVNHVFVQTSTYVPPPIRRPPLRASCLSAKRSLAGRGRKTYESFSDMRPEDLSSTNVFITLYPLFALPFGGLLCIRIGLSYYYYLRCSCHPGGPWIDRSHMNPNLTRASRPFLPESIRGIFRVDYTPDRHKIWSRRLVTATWQSTNFGASGWPTRNACTHVELKKIPYKITEREGRGSRRW